MFVRLIEHDTVTSVWLHDTSSEHVVMRFTHHKDGTGDHEQMLAHDSFAWDRAVARAQIGRAFI